MRHLCVRVREVSGRGSEDFLSVVINVIMR